MRISDSLSNVEKYQLSTDVDDPDSVDDGTTDGRVVALGRDPRPATQQRNQLLIAECHPSSFQAIGNSEHLFSWRMHLALVSRRKSIHELIHDVSTFEPPDSGRLESRTTTLRTQLIEKL